MIRVSTHPLLSSSVLHLPLHLVSCHGSNAHISISEVGAQLLGLHPLSPGESAAETLVNVAVAAVPALLAKLSHPRSRSLTHAIITHEPGLTVIVSVALLSSLLTEDWQTVAGHSVRCVHTDSSLAAVLVAGALLLSAGIIHSGVL